ncbi:DUF2461 domain-containing protein [Rubricoccus marinus]|uniref:TIGR02453 family protein n=1 Tax=Rubricoccus marinus TaxID=716817 RepID=A0A259U0L1_9BACT|nr:DUF2461 domain-containing protein [Rubricoccus marinus]OZC03378.1 TIGR02453 family protein [Rubricoccus marinus]
MTPDSLPPFPGFRDEAFAFLRDLRAHNERDWFKPRKATYDDELLWPARCLVGELAEAMPRAGLPLTGDPKKAPFRIYRDTRFSKNKAPYKTHLGLVLSRDGKKKSPGSLYVHVEPEHCFLAAGFWAMESPLLRRWRERIAGAPEAWLAVVEELEGSGLTLGTGPAGTLKRMPRGFEGFADAAIAPYLKWKGTVATREVAPEATQSPGFAGDVVAFAQDAMPLLAWGWNVADAAPGA